MLIKKYALLVAFMMGAFGVAPLLASRKMKDRARKYSKHRYRVLAKYKIIKYPKYKE
jgi:hypothetical protein